MGVTFQESTQIGNDDDDDDDINDDGDDGNDNDDDNNNCVLLDILTEMLMNFGILALIIVGW